MKRSPMKRGAPLQRRTPLRSKPKAYEPRERTPAPLPAPGSIRFARTACPRDEAPRPMPKDDPVQHERYMAAVRTLSCIRCGIAGYTQFAHADWNGQAGGKGLGLKSDCRRGYPACGPHDNTMGCHHLIGSTGTLPRAERHRLEAEYGRRTRSEILRRGLWPADLPLWVEEPANEDQFIPTTGATA